MDIKTRFLFKPQQSSAEAVPIEQGGTGAVSAKEARQNLVILGVDELNKPNGAIARDAQGFLSKDVFPPEIADPSIPSLFGPSTVVTETTVQFLITNFDSAAIYTAVGVGGVLTRNVDLLEFKAGINAGSGAIIINGRTYPITLVFPDIETPLIESPLEGDTLEYSAVTITSSAFQLAQNGASHLETEWQLATDSQFTEILESVSTSESLTTWTPVNMKELTTHYVRCRYKSASGLISAWSTPRTFVTGNDGLVNTEIQRLIAGNYYNDQRFGRSLSVSDDKNHLLISALSDDNTQSDSGAVYYFQRVNGVYTQVQYIKAPTPLQSDAFGERVSMTPDGLLAIVGAPGWTGLETRLGAAYIYTRSGNSWSMVQKLEPADSGDGRPGDIAYGGTVAISRDGTTIAVGAPYYAEGKGAIFVYTKVGGVWTLQTKLMPSQGDTWQDVAWMHLNISADGNTIAAGAHGADIGGFTDAGCIYVFTRSGSVWSEQAKLTASDMTNNTQLGFASGSLSDDGNLLIAGVPNTGNSPQGAGYVFKRTGSTWAQVQKIVPSDLQTGDIFGLWFDLKGNKLTTSKSKTTPYAGSGEVYIYTFNGTTFDFVNKIVPTLTYANTWFGYRPHLSYDGTVGFIPYLTQNQGDQAGSVGVFV